MMDGPHVDKIDLSTLRGPLLSGYYGSAIQRQDVLKIAEEVMRRHLAKLPSDTGNLRSTARISTPRVRHEHDTRYEAVYSIGGPRADYIVPLEAEHHYLDEVLREMGFTSGDIVNGPKGRINRADEMVTVYHRSRTAEGAQGVVEGGFQRGSRGDWVYFNLDLNSASSPRGDYVVVAQVRRGDLFRDNEDEGRAVRARRQHVTPQSMMEHVGQVPNDFPDTPDWLQNDNVMRPRGDDFLPDSPQG